MLRSGEATVESYEHLQRKDDLFLNFVLRMKRFDNFPILGNILTTQFFHHDYPLTIFDTEGYPTTTIHDFIHLDPFNKYTFRLLGSLLIQKKSLKIQSQI